MNNATILFGLLTLIIISKGVLQLNEPFLVAICFVSFMYVAYSKVGSIVADTLNTRSNQLISDSGEVKKVQEDAFNGVINSFNNNVKVASRLNTINSVFEKYTLAFIAQQELALQHQVKTEIVSLLQDLAQQELASRQAMKKLLVTRFINRLKALIQIRRKKSTINNRTFTAISKQISKLAGKAGKVKK